MTKFEIEEKVSNLVADGYRRHHKAIHRNYVKSKSGSIEPYKGKFGKGLVVVYPTDWHISRSHHTVEYLIK